MLCANWSPFRQNGQIRTKEYNTEERSLFWCF